MNHEFYQIMVGAPTMSLYSWKQLAHWSIEYSCLSPKEKTKGYKILAETWQDFCQTIVDICDNETTGLMKDDQIDEEKAKKFFERDTRSEWRKHTKKTATS